MSYLINIRYVLSILLISFLFDTIKAQPDPDRLKALVTIYPSENLQSEVYPWPKATGSKPVDSFLLASGSTTHLKSLKISAKFLMGSQSLQVIGHEESEHLLIVKEGQLSMSINEDRQELGPGSVALILPGDQYNIINLRSQPAVYYLLEYQSKASLYLDRARSAGGSFMIEWNEIAYNEHGKGGRRDFFDRPTAACESFEMHVTNLNVNTSSHDPHTHQVEEIILMVQGKISMHIDGQETEASVGDFAFVDSNIPHAPTNIGSEQAIYFAFQWK